MQPVSSRKLKIQSTSLWARNDTACDRNVIRQIICISFELYRHWRLTEGSKHENSSLLTAELGLSGDKLFRTGWHLQDRLIGRPSTSLYSNFTVMPKRFRDEAASYAEHGRPRKRSRPDKKDRLSSLSDELLLRTLSFLSTPDLLLCERCV